MLPANSMESCFVEAPAAVLSKFFSSSLFSSFSFLSLDCTNFVEKLILTKLKGTALKHKLKATNLKLQNFFWKLIVVVIVRCKLIVGVFAKVKFAKLAVHF